MHFCKMHGLGNDFVILDQRTNVQELTKSRIMHICDRHLGVGCDQLIVLRAHAGADAEMMIYNPDGERAGMCGNAARCAVWLIASGQVGAKVRLVVGERGLTGVVTGAMQVQVEMGMPDFTPSRIPVLTDTAHDLPPMEGYTPAGCVSMGNPHVVFFVPDVESVDVAEVGAKIERHPLFPERVNVEFAEVISPHHIKMRVWERGAGLTQACGSGACAVAVLALQADYVEGPEVHIAMPGGALSIYWRPKQQVRMTGAVAHVFSGVFT